MSNDAEDLLKGTLDMLILKSVELAPMHGWGISQRIQQFSRGVLDVNQGSLYPALQAMLRRGWIKAAWGPSENNRRARYYSITREGREQLESEISEWQRSTAAVNRVLRLAFQGG
jgi:transcriptional regulator